MGRNATPTNIHKLHGNPGKRALPVNEPEPEAIASDALPPKQIENMPEAVKAWQDVLPRLCNMRVMTEADIPMLVLYCEAYADAVNATAMMGEGGAVQVAASGHAQVSAWYTVKKDAVAKQMKILSLFGMSPSDRTKVQTVGVKKKSNKFA